MPVNGKAHLSCDEYIFATRNCCVYYITCGTVFSAKLTTSYQGGRIVDPLNYRPPPASLTEFIPPTRNNPTPTSCIDRRSIKSLVRLLRASDIFSSLRTICDSPTPYSNSHTPFLLFTVYPVHWLSFVVPHSFKMCRPALAAAIIASMKPRLTLDKGLEASLESACKF